MDGLMGTGTTPQERTVDERIRVVLADDHAILLEGLHAILDRHPDIEVVGEAHDGREAVELAAHLEPDVVLMDIGMPKMNGVAATEAIRATTPSVRVLILTQYSDRQYAVAVLKAGASGYLLKATVGSELANALHVVASGGKYINATVAGMLADELSQPSEALTARERDVLRHIAAGESNQQIAAALSLSVKTVEWHRTNLMAKCHAHNAVELLNYAHAHHLVDTF